jgi:hypothetical protein
MLCPLIFVKLTAGGLEAVRGGLNSEIQVIIWLNVHMRFVDRYCLP